MKNIDVDGDSASDIPHYFGGMCHLWWICGMCHLWWICATFGGTLMWNVSPLVDSEWETHIFY